jgi:hypothetical protein
MSASRSINPASLPGMEVALWSPNIVGTDGAVFATYPDSSGNGRDATQATAGQKAILRKTGADISPNGKQMAQFDGDDDLMVGSLPGGGISNADGYSLYFYVKELSLTTGGFNTQTIFAASNLDVLTRTSTDAGYADNQKYGLRGTGSNRVIFGATATGYQIITAIYYPPSGAGGVFRLFKDGVQSGADATNWDVALATGYNIGNAGSANVGFNGTMGAILLFSHAHPPSIRLGVEAYIRDYFER